MQEEPTIPDIVDEHYWEMLGEEPVSEDMWEASKQYALRQVFASTDAEMTEQAYLSLKLFSGFEIAVAHKDGANWQKQKDKSKVLTEEQCRKIRDDAFELGKDAMMQQLMAKAVGATVHIDAGGYPYIPQMELYDYDKDIPLAKEGKKVKVIVIKED
jgi:oligoribonuclease NrnB/cAMP/cGMP phosphodiesterase (DHH superfamily)